MKSKEELNAIKAEAEALGSKLCELTEEELEQVAGGVEPNFKLKLAGIIGLVTGGSAGFFFQTVDTTEDQTKGE